MKLIQPATPEDFEKYFDLRWRILRKPWNQPRGTEQDTQENSSYHIMAMQDHKLLGVARLQFPKPKLAQLRYMAVDDLQQNQGVGRAIVEHMETYARQQNANELFLHARDNALIFYQKMGYQITEKSYLLFESIQHYKMHKIL